MQIQLIRNATLRMTYGDHTFIIDPYLAPKHTSRSFTGRSRNPMVELPCSPEAAIADAEMVLVSHLHTDHFDDAAQALLPKDVALFCQPGDAAQIRSMGFTQVAPIETEITWQGVSISRVAGRHGSSPEVLGMMGAVAGFIFQAENEPTIYWAGDTVLYTAVYKIIDTYRPDIIITHSCGAVWGEGELIVMDAQQTIAVCQYAPGGKVLATHMDALDHGTISRQALRTLAQECAISEEQLIIPNDGEVLEFTIA